MCIQNRILPLDGTFAQRFLQAPTRVAGSGDCMAVRRPCRPRNTLGERSVVGDAHAEALDGFIHYTRLMYAESAQQWRDIAEDLELLERSRATRP